jgi:hypothetical protein
MNWLSGLIPNKYAKIFAKAAERIFSEVCEGDSHAAHVYRQYPNVRKEHYEAICTELKQLAKTEEGPPLTQALRGKFAEVVELVVFDHWYTNLDEHDRDLISKHILSSNRQTQDQVYYLSFAENYAFATILEFVIFQGWDGEDASKSHLSECHRGFVDMCKDHCDMALLLASAMAEGRQITDEEKERGQTTIMLKEATRRALAGERVIDE